MAIVLLIFLGLTGIWGGYELISNPSGTSLKMPLELLEGTPFKDYRIPGILLFLGNGVLGLVVAAFSWKGVRGYPNWIVLQGGILLLWLTAELVFNPAFFFPQTHLTYYAIGLVLVIAGLKLSRIDGKQGETKAG